MILKPTEYVFHAILYMVALNVLPKAEKCTRNGNRLSYCRKLVPQPTSNQNNESINESKAAEQQVEHNPVSNNAGPTGEVMTTSSRRVSHAPTRLIEEMGKIVLMAAK